MELGSAQNPHVLRVRSGFCALSVSKLAAPITPTGIGSYYCYYYMQRFFSNTISRYCRYMYITWRLKCQVYCIDSILFVSREI
ncbi:hypothetical protein SEEHRA35_012765 [Salmonella enterica subsp. enterica serovar Heidelberg str. SARA35]|nr:hypothetical protein SEEHRA35_012765 [Salmonella enterica subsp. enterica serovar Heidelberg str. SARA35]APY50082.1 hypothetical protein LFZ7_07475 [Salmonella enterica subsp. enterica serovar Crossness str. 1422-74]OZR02927.1 hypothetical protein CH243_13445 [Salmonella enterica subsp. enterica serovar Heidelberg]OZR10099.1 hypothetical protein CH242_14565 [Salmonella enterica subsp. enterica serovar Heidelberg]OZT21772.1 hypothetical protein CH226_14220 [Salmonella enterica subsp. enterica